MTFLMIFGDFLRMSLTTDKVKPSPVPNSWNIARLSVARVVMGLVQLALSVAFFGCRGLCRRSRHATTASEDASGLLPEFPACGI